MSLYEKALPLVKHWARAQFRDDTEKIADAVSEAWILAQENNPKATPGGIAWIAIRRVGWGEQFAEGSRSFTGPLSRKTVKPHRNDFHDYEHFSGGDPASEAALRMDFEEFAKTLSPQREEVMLGILMGENNRETGERMGITAEAVNYHRQLIIEQWTSRKPFVPPKTRVESKGPAAKELAVEMAQQGKLHREIAEAIGVDRGTVSRWLKCAV